ncbi:Tol-Pal system beta propeller repeat protein TolB [Chromatium okenii]|uniref:Tol-Pal system beta propeller repeat protein TolB n=1 Tax=Chromatium okenii TaxID=61644 RepID=UPI0026EABB5A|nr:Tol-Pal system beta propeller repeat protein TolB [Chromatium okenii]MBV5308480.1 Tol-Pal system beta propeller repeat protein TolB [Chromatium okenii]
MRKDLSLLLLTLITIFGGINSSHAAPRLNIEITGGVEAAQPIAVVPFGMTDGQNAPVDVAAVISADLARTGKFKPLPVADMLTQPTTREAIDPRDWRLLGVNTLVIGQLTPAEGGLRISVVIYDVMRGSELTSTELVTSTAGLRHTAHQIADLIYKTLTGQPGVAATRIAYVTASGSGEKQTVSLRVADADGENPQTIMSSGEPILSPAWSPDGQLIAYVSFENQRPAIYIQDLRGGQRVLVASYPGINSAPAFSPDGKQLAMTLSKDGNSEIYVLDLVSRELRRLTDHFGIDTEPAWSPDGQQLIFTSNRGGNPQIYRMPASGGAAERISVEGDYNVCASFAPDGRSIVMVTRINGALRIAVLDVERHLTRLLTNGTLDESPSFAPNGALVIYATTHNGRGVLATVAIEGGSSLRLSQSSGQMREPAWSPPPLAARMDDGAGATAGKRWVEIPPSPPFSKGGNGESFSKGNDQISEAKRLAQGL